MNITAREHVGLLSNPVRESMRPIGSRLPQPLYVKVQKLLTWATGGLPLHDAIPPDLAEARKHQMAAAIRHLLTAICCFALGFHLMSLGWSPLWLIGLYLSGGAMRRFQVIIMHHAAHGNLIGDRQFDAIIGNVTAVTFLLGDFSSYKAAHRVHHTLHGLNTRRDDTIQVLVGLAGLKPGAAAKDNFLRLSLASVSPLFHLRFAVRRCRSLFCPRHLRWVTAATWVAWGCVCLVFKGWIGQSWPHLVAMNFAYQFLSIWRLSFEHTLDPSVQKKRGRLFIARTTGDVFMLWNPYPSHKFSPAYFFCQLRFWAGICLMATLRFGLLPADVPTHSVHSRLGRDMWWISHWQRHKALLDGCLQFPEPYWYYPTPWHAIWGNLQALSKVEASQL